MTDPSRVRITGPLSLFAQGFAAELARQGYRPNAAANQLQLIAHLSRWLAAKGMDVGSLSSAVLREFLIARRAQRYTLWLSPQALMPFLGYLRHWVDVAAIAAAPQCDRRVAGSLSQILARRPRPCRHVGSGICRHGPPIRRAQSSRRPARLGEPDAGGCDRVHAFGMSWPLDRLGAAVDHGIALAARLRAHRGPGPQAAGRCGSVGRRLEACRVTSSARSCRS